MGLPQIKDKLKNEFLFLESEENTLDEKDVVYFLVEVRKMLYHEKKTRVFPAIKFYADWVVHIQKDYIPKFIEDMMKTSEDKLDEFVKMKYLKQEITQFLKSHELPILLVNDKNWEFFWRKLICVLSEQPLILKGTMSKFEFCTNANENIITFDYEM